MRDEGKTREPVLRRNLPTSPTGNFEVTSPRRAIRPRDCCLSLAGSPQQRQALPPSGGGPGAARSSLPPKAARCLSCGHVQRQPIATTKSAGMVFAQADVRNVRLRTCVSNSDSKQQSKRDNPGRAVGGCRCRAANYIPVPQIHGSRRGPFATAVHQVSARRPLRGQRDFRSPRTLSPFSGRWMP